MKGATEIESDPFLDADHPATGSKLHACSQIGYPHGKIGIGEKLDCFRFRRIS